MSAPTSFGLQASSPFGSPFFIVPVMSQSCTHAQAQIQFSCIACSPKEFLCLVLTSRYQDQILLNHVACQICLPLPGFWFSTHKCGASSSPRPTTWICKLVPGICSMCHGCYGWRWRRKNLGPWAQKATDALPLEGLILPTSLGAVGSVNILISPILCATCDQLPLSMWELADMMIELLKL